MSRIWIINQFAGKSDSGWGERHYYLSQYWKEMGYEPVIISGSFNHMFSKLPRTEGKYSLEEKDGITYCWVRTPRYSARSPLRFYSMLVFAWRCFWLDVRWIGRPDIVLVSSMPLFPIYAVLKRRKKWGFRALILELRDIWPLSLIHLGGVSHRHPLVHFIGWFEKMGYKGADAVSSVLPKADKHIEKVAGKKVNFHYIPNGISPDHLQATPLPETHSDLLNTSAFKVVYTGTIGLANAMEHFVGAAKILRDREDILFVVVGEGYFKEKLMAEAAGLSNILFLSKVEKKQVQEILKLADLCYIGWRKIPLYDHGVSANKYFDYMLAARPVLVSADFEDDPVSASGCGLRVAAEDPAQIADGVLKVFHWSEEKRVQTGEKGKSFVLKNHHYKKLAADYVRLFKSLAPRVNP